MANPYLGTVLRRARARGVTKTPEDASDPLVLPLGQGFAAQACGRSKVHAARRTGLPAPLQQIQPKIVPNPSCGFGFCFRLHDRAAACGHRRANHRFRRPLRYLLRYPLGARDDGGRLVRTMRSSSCLRQAECSVRSAFRSRPSIFDRVRSRWKSQCRHGRRVRCGRSGGRNRRRDGGRRN